MNPSLVPKLGLAGTSLKVSPNFHPSVCPKSLVSKNSALPSFVLCTISVRENFRTVLIIFDPIAPATSSFVSFLIKSNGILPLAAPSEFNVAPEKSYSVAGMNPNNALAAILEVVVLPPQGIPNDSVFKNPPTIGISLELHIVVSDLLIGNLIVSIKAIVPAISSSGTFIESFNVVVSPSKNGIAEVLTSTSLVGIENVSSYISVLVSVELVAFTSSMLVSITPS